MKLSKIEQQNSTAPTWIAIGYDSAQVYTLGESAAAAQLSYENIYGPPPLGFFSEIVTAADHEREYKRAAQALELEGVPVYLAENWVIVAQITSEGVKALEGKQSPAKLLRQGMKPSAREGQTFMLDAKPPRESRYQTREQRREARQNPQPINGIAPSDRQRDYAKQHVSWLDAMAWAHTKGEITLTADELAYARARYGDSVDKIHVNSVYRLTSDTQR